MTQLSDICEYSLYQLGALIDELSELYRTPEGRALLAERAGAIEAAKTRLANLAILAGAEAA